VGGGVTGGGGTDFRYFGFSDKLQKNSSKLVDHLLFLRAVYHQVNMSLRKLTSFTTAYTRATLNLSQRSLATAIRFHETGEASKVLKLEQLDSDFINAKLGPNEIGLKFLAAPINPSDINIVS
jgi:hypothetical protein